MNTNRESGKSGITRIRRDTLTIHQERRYLGVSTIVGISVVVSKSVVDLNSKENILLRNPAREQLKACRTYNKGG